MYEKIALISPYFEVFLRKLYWKNVKALKKFRPKRALKPRNRVNWDDVIYYLVKIGLGDGKLMVLHSSFEAIWSSGLSPAQIIKSLRVLLGDEGTLAMPVFRKYKEDPPLDQILTTDFSKMVCTYNPYSSKIWSGVLPFFLTKEEDVVISRYPLNSMAAVGKLAVPMMADNIVEDYLPPCGKHSSWAFCLEEDAIIVGIGIDLCHSLTITHVAADLFLDEWPIKNWYRKRVFNIVDGTFTKQITVLEREDRWGCFYLAASNYRKDLINNKILISETIGGVIIEFVYAKKLLDFLRLRNRDGNPYPYYIPNRFFK